VVSKPKKRQRPDAALKESARIGRPALEDPAAKRDVPIHVLTTKSEKEELQRAADDADMGISTWIRRVALERARANAAEKAKQAANG